MGSDFLSPNRSALQQTLACEAQLKFPPPWVTGCQLEIKFQERLRKAAAKNTDGEAAVTGELLAVRETRCEVEQPCPSGSDSQAAQPVNEPGAQPSTEL